jgi:hypothetical protein
MTVEAPHSGPSGSAVDAATRPSFFLVGALKSGTTAMAIYLGQHPQIHLPVKECCFFGSDLQFRPGLQRSGDWFRPTEERYLSFFEEAPTGARVGEASSYYLCSKRAAEEIRAFNPDASIIAMLRNPVDMVYSMHNHWLYSLNEDIPEFSAALAAEDDRREGRRLPDGAFWPDGLQYRSIPRYAEQLERFFDVFGRERVHVVLFDDFLTDVRSCYRSVLEFLGVDPDFQPAFEVVNAAKQVRSRGLQRLFLSPPGWLEAVARPLLDRPELRERLRGIAKGLNTRPARTPKMSPALRAELSAHFRPEVERLSRLLERDLTAWTR